MTWDKTPQQVAEILDLDEKTVRRWCNLKSDPCPHKRTRSGVIRLNEAEIAAWMQAHQLTGRPGRPAKDAGGGAGQADALTSAKLRKENALAATYELDLAERRGDLLDGELVKARWAGIGNVIRNGFQNLAAQLVPIAKRQGMPQSGAAVFQAETQAMIDGILAALAGGGFDERATAAGGDDDEDDAGE